MVKESVSNVLAAEAKEIERLVETVDYEAIERLLNRIAGDMGKKIFFTGCGTSSMAANKAVHTFRVINLPAFYINPSDAVHGSLGVVGEGDIVFVISKGGNTKELTSFLDNLKSKKAYIVAVTENEESIIGKAADAILKIKIEREPDAYNMLATASTLAVISVFDAMAITLMKMTGFSKAIFLENHPSGAVGDRLQSDVK